jgi:hypothetical protein
MKFILLKKITLTLRIFLSLTVSESENKGFYRNVEPKIELTYIENLFKLG